MSGLLRREVGDESCLSVQIVISFVACDLHGEGMFVYLNSGVIVESPTRPQPALASKFGG